tara:strand:+ start:1016 stop:1195 length:180 start_codon:yes stop_codon:yes gene_type:complete
MLEFRDNRLAGLLREISEAIAAIDDPTTLRRFGITLKAYGDEARSRGYNLQNPKGNRTW